MDLPVLIIHGWSDNSSSFRPLGRFLREHGADVREVFLGDYLSMRDEITLADVGFAMIRALRDRDDISLERHGFDVVVHSTGGLVVREFLRQFCRDADGKPDARRTPVRNLLMLAPANFGSTLAKMGKSMVGRLFKGWKWDGFFETGEALLDALELGSPISTDLARTDLFDPAFPVFDPENTRVTVMVGSNGYGGRLKKLVHENGSDGTVRVAAANLNARRFRVDFADPVWPGLKETPRNCGDLALAVLDRDHGTITKDLKRQREAWRRVVLDSLSVSADGYPAHVAACDVITRETFRTGRGRRKREMRERFHEYMQVVFRVTDQYGNGIGDYFIEFYQREGDDADAIMEKIHGEILEKVKVNSIDHSYRTFFFDLTDLREELEREETRRIDMSVIAANPSEAVTYRNPPEAETAGIRVFEPDNERFFLPNRTVLVDLILHRDPGSRVFGITREWR